MLLFFLTIFTQLNDIVRILCSMHTKRMVYVHTKIYIVSTNMIVHIKNMCIAKIFSIHSVTVSAVNMRRFVAMWRYLSQPKLAVCTNVRKTNKKKLKKKPNRYLVRVIFTSAAILNATSGVFRTRFDKKLSIFCWKYIRRMNFCASSILTSVCFD